MVICAAGVQVAFLGSLMALADDIRAHAKSTFTSAWTTRKGNVVPAPSDLKLSNDAVEFDRVTILYADLDQSTSLVETQNWGFAAEVYKTFLYAASRLIRDGGGSIVSYDGDRVMGIFNEGNQNNQAVSCALRINYAIKNIVQQELTAFYSSRGYTIRHIVGIDESPVRAARTGVRGDNDLVWVGNAANLAAKLTALSADSGTWITAEVHKGLVDSQKRGPNGEDIWKKWAWSQHGSDTVYSTTYWRSF
jgi:class 3 adenylate cyclase